MLCGLEIKAKDHLLFSTLKVYRILLVHKRKIIVSRKRVKLLGQRPPVKADGPEGNPKVHGS